MNRSIENQLTLVRIAREGKTEKSTTKGSYNNLNEWISHKHKYRKLDVGVKD